MPRWLFWLLISLLLPCFMQAPCGGQSLPPLPPKTYILDTGTYLLRMIYSPNGVDRRDVSGKDVVFLSNLGYFNSDGQGDPASWKSVDLLVVNHRVIVPALQNVRSILLIGQTTCRVVTGREAKQMRKCAQRKGRIWPFPESVAVGLDDHCQEPLVRHGHRLCRSHCPCERDFYGPYGKGAIFFERYGTEKTCRAVAQEWGGNALANHLGFGDSGVSCYLKIRPRQPECGVIVRVSSTTARKQKIGSPNLLLYMALHISEQSAIIIPK